MWMLIITCAIGVSCGLKAPYTHHQTFKSEGECRLVFDWGMDLFGGGKRLFRGECRKVES